MKGRSWSWQPARSPGSSTHFGTAENVIDLFARGLRHNSQVIVFATGELLLDRLVVFGGMAPASALVSSLQLIRAGLSFSFPTVIFQS